MDNSLNGSTTEHHEVLPLRLIQTYILHISSSKRGIQRKQTNQFVKHFRSLTTLF